jgi:hypothetical protein
MENGGLRQRRKAETPLTGSARKRLIPPPKSSFLMCDADIVRTPQNATAAPSVGNHVSCLLSDVQIALYPDGN